MRSNKIIIFINIVFTYLQEVEASVTLLAVFDRPNESFKLVNIEGFGPQTLGGQRVHLLFFNEVKHLVEPKVNVLGTMILKKLVKLKFSEHRQVLTVVLDPHRLSDIQLVPKVKCNCAYVEETYECEHVAREVCTLTVSIEPSVKIRLVSQFGLEILLSPA